MGVGGQRYAQAFVPLSPPPGNEPLPNCTGGWVGPRAGLDGCRYTGPLPCAVRMSKINAIKKCHLPYKLHVTMLRNWVAQGITDIYTRYTWYTCDVEINKFSATMP